MDPTMIPSVISGLKVAGDMAKGLLQLNNLSEVQGKVIELQSAILSAQSSALEANAEQQALKDENRALKAEIENIKAWQTEKQRYKLHAPFTGSVVYALVKSKANGEPSHWICTSCYEKGRKSILNQVGGDRGIQTSFGCPVCKSQVPTPYRGPVPTSYADE